MPYRGEPAGAVQTVYTHPGWIPLTHDGGGNHVGVELAPGPLGRAGQVVVFDPPAGMREMVAECYGFRPTVGVSVQRDKFVDDRRDREGQALDVLAALLRDDDGDLYADHYDGKPALLRRAGLVTADERWLASRPWAAKSLPVPVRTGAVPSTV